MIWWSNDGVIVGICYGFGIVGFDFWLKRRGMRIFVIVVLLIKDRVYTNRSSPIFVLNDYCMYHDWILDLSAC